MRGADRITLTGVAAFGRHGVLEHERREGQQFVVDLSLHVDLTRAAGSDDLSHTVSYADVAADVVAAVGGEPLDLLEALAARIADVVLARPSVEAVEVTVHKPQAPVGVPFADVAVTLRRERDVPVVIALGANLQEPEQTVRRAAVRLHRVRGLRAVRLSPLYRTEPVGGPDQPPYVNAVAVGRTRLAPASLLAELHRLEDHFGRTRLIPSGPRTLDLDLVQYGVPGEASEVRCEDPALMLPHPRAGERGFVLAPWQAVDPAARLRLGDDVVDVSTALRRVDLAGVEPLPAGERP